MGQVNRQMRFGGLATAAACACLALTLSACSVAATSGSASDASGSASGYSESSEVSSSAQESGDSGASSASSSTSVESDQDEVPTKDGVVVHETLTSAADGEHVIQVDGTVETYENVAVSKTGDSDSGDEADFYGDNAAVFATNGATLNLADVLVQSDGTHANGVFSYGEGTTVNVVDSVIETAGNCSGGLMTTGGATMNAENLSITTSGNSSAAIRSDRGGGTVTVKRGTYTTSGTGSPVIYSTADITVSDAQLESTASQGVVVEGKNSVTLNDVQLVADNNKKNSDKSDVYQAVMIYQSMSGDAASGTASFTMDGGSLTNKNGDVFFVNNTACDITLSGADIVNEGDGVFLRAAAAGWGSEGSNGGQVNLNASNQAIDGDFVVDSVSNLNLSLDDGSTFTGAINADGAAGGVYVKLADGAKWTLTADSYITSLTCDADSIDLNGYVLHVGDGTYEAGTASEGEAIEFPVSESAGKGAPDGKEPPSGAPDGQEPPSGAPDGQEPPSGAPDAEDAQGSDSSQGAAGASSSSKPPSKPSEAGKRP